MTRYILAAILAALVAIPAWAGTQTTSSSTVADIIDRLEQDVNHETDDGGFYSDAEAVEWINEAVQIALTYGRLMETSEDVTLANGTMSYSLTASHFDIESVLHDNGDSTDKHRYRFLSKVDPRLMTDSQKISAAGRPQFWWQWDDGLYLWPVPGADEDGETVQVFLIEKPDALTATTDSIPTPYYLDSTILLYAKAKYHEKQEKETRGTYYRNLFYQELERYRVEIRGGISGGGQ
jgi:hypothetical protein